MEKTDTITETTETTITEILNGLSSAAHDCHLCPESAVAEMFSATEEIDSVVSSLTGHPRSLPPGGGRGASEARFFLMQAKEKIQSFQAFTLSEPELRALEDILFSVSEFRRGLPV